MDWHQSVADPRRQRRKWHRPRGRRFDHFGCLFAILLVICGWIPAEAVEVGKEDCAEKRRSLVSIGQGVVAGHTLKQTRRLLLEVDVPLMPTKGCKGCLEC
jgi:hypothetical protein